MMNQVILVGRLCRDPIVNKTENGKKRSFITIAVPRSFKNMDGEYETDFIDCTLWDVVAENTSEYCHKGDIIGVKGRIQSYVIEKKNKEDNIYGTEIIAEKITFLTSNPKNEQ